MFINQFNNINFGWNIKTHIAITEQALSNNKKLSPVEKRMVGRFSQMPDLIKGELQDMNSAHFYDALNETRIEDVNIRQYDITEKDYIPNTKTTWGELMEETGEPIETLITRYKEKEKIIVPRHEILEDKAKDLSSLFDIY